MQEDDYFILLSRLLDDELDEEQGRQLMAFLEQDPERLQDIAKHLGLWELYSQSICTERGAQRFTESWQTRVVADADADRFVRDFEINLEKDTTSDQDRMHETEHHARDELEAFPAEQRPSPPARQSHRRIDWDLKERIRIGVEGFRDMLSTGVRIAKVMAVCVAVALATPTAVHYFRARRVVATLQNAVDAQWTVSPQHTQLQRGWLELREGFAQLAFKSGAEAILQAPCRLRLESPRALFLASGMLAVKVSEPTSGFLVHTPNSTINDLGTEFGVIVRQNGETEAQVYQGIVELSKGAQALPNDQTRVLKPGQAARVDSAGKIVAPPFKARRFMCALPESPPFGIPGKRLDLSDVLVGGSGVGTGDPNQMVDIRTGIVSDFRHDSANPYILGQGGYVSQSLACVDYLFTADGGNGPVQVSSLGHHFADCPDTDGQVFPYLSNRGLLRHIPGVMATQVINGQAYGTCANPIIAMHSNAGITFDLQAIRTTLSGIQISRFTALGGISETAGIAVVRELGLAPLFRADFWVLVDGKERFRRKGLQAHSGGVPISIDLNDSDRFLTLIVTDGGDGNGYDWGAFAEPALELN